MSNKEHPTFFPKICQEGKTKRKGSYEVSVFETTVLLKNSEEAPDKSSPGYLTPVGRREARKNPLAIAHSGAGASLHMQLAASDDSHFTRLVPMAASTAVSQAWFWSRYFLPGCRSEPANVHVASPWGILL